MHPKLLVDVDLTDSCSCIHMSFKNFGFIGMTSDIAGSEINLNVLEYKPPRNGPTLWEIGIPDRTAGEFYIPDPNPAFRSTLYSSNPNQEK